MGALMDSPKGRAAIYKLFIEDGDNILVKFPDTYQVLSFRKGKPQKLSPVSFWISEDGRYIKMGLGSSHVTACDGIRLLEQAYSIHRHNGYSDANITGKDVQDIFFMGRQMKRLTSGLSMDAIQEIVGKENVIVTRVSDKKDYVKFLEEYANNPNVIVTFGTLDDMPAKDNLDLHKNHAYHVVGYDKKTGMVSISNPWHNNEVTTMPVMTWMKYVHHFEIEELL
jgi:hypothetical protein